MDMAGLYYVVKYQTGRTGIRFSVQKRFPKTNTPNFKFIIM